MPESKKEGAGFFRLHANARSFISNRMKGQFGGQQTAPMMQMYWLCAQLGLVAYSKDISLPEPAGADNELTQDFAGKTRDYQTYYRSFVMYRHLCGLGYVDFDEEMSDPIEQAMNNFLQATNSHLTNDGIKVMDRFAQKGWDIIESRKLDKTQTLSDFLCEYVDLIVEHS